jgi:hypothetical protein
MVKNFSERNDVMKWHCQVIAPRHPPKLHPCNLRNSRLAWFPIAKTTGKRRFFNPNSEVAGGGGADDALSECARPRAQQLASFKPRNISQMLAHPTWLRPGRPHSTNIEIQLRSSGSTLIKPQALSTRSAQGFCVDSIFGLFPNAITSPGGMPG